MNWVRCVSVWASRPGNLRTWQEDEWKVPCITTQHLIQGERHDGGSSCVMHFYPALTQLFRIHKNISISRPGYLWSNYTTEGWLKGVVMDWMVTLWNTLLQTVSWMLSVTVQRGKTAATGSWLCSQRTPSSLCALTHKMRQSKGKERTRTGTRAKDKGIILPKKCLQSWFWTPLLRLLFISCRPSWHAHLALGT